MKKLFNLALCAVVMIAATFCVIDRNNKLSYANEYDINEIIEEVTVSDISSSMDDIDVTSFEIDDDFKDVTTNNEHYVKVQNIKAWKNDKRVVFDNVKDIDKYGRQLYSLYFTSTFSDESYDEAMAYLKACEAEIYGVELGCTGKPFVVHVYIDTYMKAEIRNNNWCLVSLYDFGIMYSERYYNALYLQELSGECCTEVYCMLNADIIDDSCLIETADGVKVDAIAIDKDSFRATVYAAEYTSFDDDGRCTGFVAYTKKIVTENCRLNGEVEYYDNGYVITMYDEADNFIYRKTTYRKSADKEYIVALFDKTGFRMEETGMLKFKRIGDEQCYIANDCIEVVALR